MKAFVTWVLCLQQASIGIIFITMPFIRTSDAPLPIERREAASALIAIIGAICLATAVRLFGDDE